MMSLLSSQQRGNPEGEEMTTKVWVAMFLEFESVHAQACATRDDALEWLVTNIDQRNWEACYDQLAPDKREGLARDKNAADPEQLFEAYFGECHFAGEQQPDTWGDGDCFIQLLEQDTYSASPA